jgi:membrane-associated phospholipid phosphatase
MWFDYLELTLTPQYITSIDFDNQLPFIKEFVVPYLLWFLFVPYGVIYVGIHSKSDFFKIVVFIFGNMVVANIVFTVFPNAQNLRPVINSDDPFSMLVKWIYSVDTPTNVCPSIHVINSIAVNAALQHSDAFSAKRFRKTASSVLTILICLSTVFIKQHSILDVICGIATAALFYIPLYILPVHRLQNKRNMPQSRSPSKGLAEEAQQDES